jgi:regulator of sirC expression with transglutaminase-like and TPR domain
MYLQNELIADQRKREIEEQAKETWKYHSKPVKHSRFLQTLLTVIKNRRTS